MTLSVLSMIVLPERSWNEPQQDWQVVSREEIVRAVTGEKASGYSLQATTNAGRLHSGIVKRLAAAALQQKPSGVPLFVDHEDNFNAYLETMGLAAGEVPLFVRQSHDHKQDQLIEYRKEKVIKHIIEGREPSIAVSVRAWWKKAIGGPDDFSYDDTLSTPNLRSISERVINARILDFGDVTVYDEIEGMKGRPISGALGTLFAAFGFVGLVPNVVQIRMAVSQDSLLLVSFTTKFLFFTKIAEATFRPDGRPVDTLAENRPDLIEIRKRLNESLKIEYFPYEKPDD
jgi:hypothetical protein